MTTEQLNNMYPIDCTGTCCVGDEITFFSTLNPHIRMYGTITDQGRETEPKWHYYTIMQTDGVVLQLAAQFLYLQPVARKAWGNREGERRKLMQPKKRRYRQHNPKKRKSIL